MKKILYTLFSLLIPFFSNAQVLLEAKAVDSFQVANSDNFYYKTIKLRDNKICILRHFGSETYVPYLDINLYNQLDVSVYTVDGIRTSHHIYPLTNGGIISDMIQTNNGELLLGGEIGNNIVFVRLDSTGNYIATKSYPNNDSITIYKFYPTHDNHVLVSMYKFTTDDTAQHICYSDYNDILTMNNIRKTYLAKIDFVGNVIWNKHIATDKTYDYGSFTNTRKIEVDILNDPNHSFNIIKHSVVSSDAKHKIEYLHFDKDGNLLLQKTLVDNLEKDKADWLNFSLYLYGYFIGNNNYQVIKKDVNANNLYTFYRFDKTGELLDSMMQPYDVVNSTYLAPIEVSLFEDIEFKSTTINNQHYYLNRLSIRNNDNKSFYLTKTDEDLKYFWEQYFVDSIANKHAIYNTRKPIFITKVDDSTLLVINQMYNPLDSNPYNTNYIKFYKISLATNQIYYTTYIDANNNGIKDGNDTIFNQALVEISDGTSTNTYPLESNGVFTTFVKRGTYLSKLISYQQNIKYFTVTPVAHATTFDTIHQIDTITFRLVPIENVQDLQVFMVPLTGARPGFDATYQLIAKNIGSKTIQNIAIKFLKDSLQTYNSYSIAPTSINNDTLIWNVDSLAVYEQKSINVICTNAVPPQLNLNDTLQLQAFITPFENDSFVTDNSFQLSQVVVNAYDPNDKIEAHGSGISRQQLNNGDYLYYTIRFQNTGNAPASIIKIVDTLSNNLDWSTLEILGNTHNLTLTVSNKNILTWYSNSTYLPDSTSNEAGSHGYISFRIKPKTNLLATDKIENRAHIYFDYNPAIVTNTVTTSILEERTTAIKNNTIKALHLFPSPTNGDVQLEFNSTLSKTMQLHIIDINGKAIRTENIATTIGFNSINISLNNLPKGIYLIQLNDKNQNLYYGKVVKQ